MEPNTLANGKLETIRRVNKDVAEVYKSGQTVAFMKDIGIMTKRMGVAA